MDGYQHGCMGMNMVVGMGVGMNLDVRMGM